MPPTDFGAGRSEVRHEGTGICLTLSDSQRRLSSSTLTSVHNSGPPALLSLQGLDYLCVLEIRKNFSFSSDVGAILLNYTYTNIYSRPVNGS